MICAASACDGGLACPSFYLDLALAPSGPTGLFRACSTAITCLFQLFLQVEEVLVKSSRHFGHEPLLVDRHYAACVSEIGLAAQHSSIVFPDLLLRIAFV